MEAFKNFIKTNLILKLNENEKINFFTDYKWSGGNILHHACKLNSDLEIIKFIINLCPIDLKSDFVRCEDENGKSSLYYSCINNNLDACKLLLEEGASVKLGTYKPIHVILSQTDNDEILKLFLEYDCCIFCHDRNGRFPLEISLINGNLKCAKLILGCAKENDYKEEILNMTLDCNPDFGYFSVKDICVQNNYLNFLEWFNLYLESS